MFKYICPVYTDNINTLKNQESMWDKSIEAFRSANNLTLDEALTVLIKKEPSLAARNYCRNLLDQIKY